MNALADSSARLAALHLMTDSFVRLHFVPPDELGGAALRLGARKFFFFSLLPIHSQLSSLKLVAFMWSGAALSACFLDLRPSTD